MDLGGMYSISRSASSSLSPSISTLVISARETLALGFRAVALLWAPLSRSFSGIGGPGV